MTDFVAAAFAFAAVKADIEILHKGPQSWSLQILEHILLMASFTKW